jgi:hypothetical protein
MFTMLNNNIPLVKEKVKRQIIDKHCPESYLNKSNIEVTHFIKECCFFLLSFQGEIKIKQGEKTDQQNSMKSK